MCLLFFILDNNFADAVFRFNANISYSGVLHAVTQDVSVQTALFVASCTLGLCSLVLPRPSVLSFVGSVLREQGETDQQRHPGSLISRCGPAGAELGAGGSVSGYQTAGGLQSRFPGLHAAPKVRTNANNLCSHKMIKHFRDCDTRLLSLSSILSVHTRFDSSLSYSSHALLCVCLRTSFVWVLMKPLCCFKVWSHGWTRTHNVNISPYISVYPFFLSFSLISVHLSLHWPSCPKPF